MKLYSSESSARKAKDTQGKVLWVSVRGKEWMWLPLHADQDLFPAGKSQWLLVEPKKGGK